jgi:hypothetical protein
MKRFVLALAVALASIAAAGAPPLRAQISTEVRLPAGYAPVEETQPVIDKTLRVHLTPDLVRLTDREQATVTFLIDVGEIFQRLHESMLHPQALKAHTDLIALDRKLASPPATQNLLALYYANKGPIARTLDGARRPILPVEPNQPGGTVYPWAVTKAEIDAFMQGNPSTREAILAPRTVVRRADKASLKKDRAALDEYPALATLHPGLKESLDGMRTDAKAFYAVPYSVAYAEDLMRASALLSKAADSIAPEDPDFADYLRNRARDLLCDDYEAGDASWVAGRFKTLNAQIGSYETYDDELYGVKTYFGLNVLVRDHARSDALRAATRELQRLEDSLPYDEGKKHKRVRSDIPVGVYEIVADFGQSRGANTATILPNEASAARKYGRTILLRNNIMSDPGLFEMSRAAYVAAIEPSFAADFTAEAGAQRTLWHEIGHYLGVDRTHDGRELDSALEHASGSLEEMKSDLVSLYLAPELERMGYYTADAKRSLYASGVRRVLLKDKPERAQVYQTMQLMQWNYFLDRGALSFNASTGRLVVHYDRFHDAVAAMLRETLAVQAAGDPIAANAFIDRWTEWRPDLHGRVAQAMRASERYRFTYVTYQALEPSRP